MITLCRLRLINWHNFTDDLLDIRQITYLIGVNGVGKTTILDALRYCLTTNKTFNALGNRKSKRTLLGSVHGKQRDQEDGKPRYTRKGHTVSYIGAEFWDDTAAQGKEPFVITVRVESEKPEEDMRHVQQLWYITPHGVTLDNLPFLGPNRVPTKREQFCLKTGKMKPIEKQGEAKDRICRALGIGAAASPLGKKFCAVFPMGTGVDDIEDFREFIYHYILPQSEINPEALQKEQVELENLNDVLLQAKNCAQLLNEIEELGKLAQAKQRDCTVNRGFVLCAKQGEAAGREELVLTAITRGNEEIERLQQQLERQEEQADQAHQRYMKAVLDNQNSSERQQLQVFQDLVQERKKEYQEEKKALSALENAIQKVESLNHSLAKCNLALAPEEMPVEIEKLPVRRQLEQLDTMERLLREREDTLDQRSFDKRNDLKQAQQRRDSLQKQIEALEKGQLIYPDNDRANQVCQAINRVFVQQGIDEDARVLCEILAVKEPDWQDCVEACLGDRRFDILVAPKHYSAAKQVFEHLGAEVGRVSLLDSRALERDAPRSGSPEAASLAAKVTSENWLAKIYVNSLLGQIIGCDTSETLEAYPHSATKDLLRHYPYRLARLRVPKQFIGLEARKRQLEVAKKEFAQLCKQIDVLAQENQLLQIPLQQCRKVRDSAALVDLRKNWGSRQRYEVCWQALEKAQKEYQAWQDNPILRGSMTAEELCRKEWDRRQRAKEDIAGELRAQERNVAEKQAEQEKIIQAAEDAQAAWQNFCQQEPLLQAEVEKKYQNVAQSRSPGAIVANQTNYQNQVDKALEEWLRDQLMPKQREYNGTYTCDYPLGLEGIQIFRERRDHLVNVDLERHITSLYQAQERCKERFREDILYRMKDDIINAKRQFRELNRSMGNLPYGEEVYQFVVQASTDTERKAFYDVIMMDSNRQLQGDGSIEDALARNDQAYEAQVEELMSRILAELKANAQRRQEGKKITTELSSYVDYRQYLDYDIECYNQVTGGRTRLSTVSQDSSGGENQAPFYIAICASLMQIYDKCENCVRLVLLDEAFSRMTSDRIRPMMKMLRQMQLQVMLITTVEKASAIQPYCDVTCSIVKSGARNAIKEFYQDVI